MRAFLGVFVPSERRTALREIQDVLMTVGADVSWIRPDQLHLTLKFLGEIPDRSDPRPDLAKLAPVKVELAGVSEFDGRIVWVGLRGDLAGLRAAAAAAEAAGTRIGVKPERRPFQAHVTIGRIRSKRGLGELRKRMEGLAGRVLGAWTLSSMSLVRTRREQGGTSYEVVRDYPFGGPR